MNDTLNQTNEPQPEKTTPGKKTSIGPVFGIIIIVVLLALGGLYYFTTGVDQVRNNEPQPVLTEEEAATLQDEAVQEASTLREQSTSNTIADIEADLEATDLSGLDDALSDFDSELNAQ
jgi:uncharacterized protein HemX